MPLEEVRSAGSLGSTASAFKGETFSRLEGYKQVIANPKAPRDDKAYALFRAINLLCAVGLQQLRRRRCGQGGAQGLVPPVENRVGFADTQWGKSLQYYW